MRWLLAAVVRFWREPTAQRTRIVEQFEALKPLPEPELRDKMRHGPKLRAVRGLAKWQERADKILRRAG